jgi:hypothetical protein
MTVRQPIHFIQQRKRERKYFSNFARQRQIARLRVALARVGKLDRWILVTSARHMRHLRRDGEALRCMISIGCKSPGLRRNGGEWRGFVSSAGC